MDQSWAERYNNTDPRTRGWILVEHPLLLLSITAAYLAFVVKIGPKLMEKRQPFKLTALMTFYNIAQIIACILVFYNLVSNGILSGNPLACKPLDLSFDEKPYNIAVIMWVNIFVKFIEFIETIVFVLRKKQNQVSGLHLYHHVSTAFFSWLTARYGAGGTGAYVITLNYFIHILMYTYYLVSIYVSPAMQKKLAKLKQTLTMMQMIQFWLMVLNCIQSFTVEECKSYRFISFLFIPNILYIFFMFKDFYTRSYLKKKQTSKVSKD